MEGPNKGALKVGTHVTERAVLLDVMHRKVWLVQFALSFAKYFSITPHGEICLTQK